MRPWQFLSHIIKGVSNTRRKKRKNQLFDPYSNLSNHQFKRSTNHRFKPVNESLSLGLRPLTSGAFRPFDLRIQGWPLSKGGSGVHYPRVAIIQGWIMGPLSKGGHYSRAGHYPRAGRAADTRNALSTFCKGALRGVAHNGGFPGRGQAAQ